MKTNRQLNLVVNILIWLAVAAGILFLLNYFVKNTTLNYYIVLLIAALASAAMVFLIIKGTTAKFTSDTKYGKLELSGPVVVFFMVLIGGYYLPGRFSDEFDLSVFVNDANGGSIKNAMIAFTIDNRKETKQTDLNGQFVIAKIPSKYRSSKIRFEPDATGFLKTVIDDSIPESGNSLYIILNKSVDSVAISGTVLQKNNTPAKNVFINFNNGLASATTDSLGNYKTTLLKSGGSEVTVMIYRNDSIIYNDKTIITSDTPVNFYLK